MGPRTGDRVNSAGPAVPPGRREALTGPLWNVSRDAMAACALYPNTGTHARISPGRPRRALWSQGWRAACRTPSRTSTPGSPGRSRHQPGKSRNDPSGETVVCERIIAALSPHTRAAGLLNAGVPLHVVQRYLGHLSPEDDSPASPGERVTHGGLGGPAAGHRGPYCGHSLRWEPSGLAPSDHKAAARRGRGQFIAVVSAWYACCQWMRSCSTRRHVPCVAVLLLVPGGVEHGRAASGPAAVTAVLLLVVLDRDHGLDGVVPEGGGADGRAAEVAGLVAGERSDAQEGDGASAGGSGERVWQPADRRVDGGERGTASRTSQAPPLQDHDQCCCPAIPRITAPQHPATTHCN